MVNVDIILILVYFYYLMFTLYLSDVVDIIYYKSNTLLNFIINPVDITLYCVSISVRRILS